MKQHFTKIFAVFIVTIIMCLSFVGCTSNNPTNVSESQNHLTIEKHTISITIENYKKYIEVSSSSSYGQSSYHFIGCLSYAYYDVSFTLSYKTSSNNDIASIKTEIVNCNAAGNGIFAGGGKYGAEIISATGTVIYWI